MKNALKHIDFSAVIASKGPYILLTKLTHWSHNASPIEWACVVAGVVLFAIVVHNLLDR